MHKSTRRNFLVFVGIMLLGLIPSEIYLLSAGFSDDSLNMVLRQTARSSLLFFLLAFVATPLRQLVDLPVARWLVRHRRSLGLAFGGMQSAHLLLIACRYAAIPGVDLNPIVGTIGGTAYLLMYLMVVTSFNAPRRFISAVAWQRLHKVGLYYNGFLFLAMLPPGADEQLLNPGRAVLIVLTTIAVLVRVAEFASHWRKSRTAKQRAVGESL
ncbi:MAG: hypothetical protein V7711_06125 [Pseudomonadales bacterium]